MTRAKVIERDERAMDFKADLLRLSERCVEGRPFLRCHVVNNQPSGWRQLAGMRDGFHWRPDLEPRLVVSLSALGTPRD